MRVLLLGLIVFSAEAQTLSLTGPATAKAGTTAQLTLTLSGSTATGPAGLQWTLVPPSGFVVQSAVIGAAANTASKVLACNAAATLCLVYGINQNVVGNGVVATATLNVPSNATPGQASVPLSGLVAVSRDAVAMPLTSGPVFSIVVLSRADINSDGVINAADIAAMANQVTSSNCSDDQNGDGRCDLIDVYVVVLRAMGL